MKRNFNVVVKDFDGNPHVRPMYKYDAAGQPVIEGGGHALKGYEQMTLRTYALTALGKRWRGEESMDFEASVKRTRLLDKLTFAMDGVVELDGEEGRMILEALKNMGADHLVVARMKIMLDTDPPAAAATVAEPGADTAAQAGSSAP